MKKILLPMMILLFLFSPEAGAKGKKQTVVFNVMMMANSKEKIKKVAETKGIVGVRQDARTNTVEVTYNSDETDIKNISDAFRSQGVSAYPIGENCSVKKGGCLNNSATQINTMR